MSLATGVSLSQDCGVLGSDKVYKALREKSCWGLPALLFRVGELAVRGVFLAPRYASVGDGAMHVKRLHLF